MRIAATKPNEQLADAVHSRMSADARLLKARAALMTLGGVGLAAFGIGAGIAVAVLAYAHLNDRTAAAAQVADAIAKALKDARLTAQIDPASTVRLDPAASVAVAPGGEVAAKGTVALEPNATVRVTGSVGSEVPRPTPAQLGTAREPATKAKVTTDYTVFKTVDFGRGEVVTGYKFAPDGDAPRSQYCYYSEQMPGKDTSVRVDLGQDGRFVGSRNAGPVDTRSAAGNCVWFNGQPTQF